MFDVSKHLFFNYNGTGTTTHNITLIDLDANVFVGTVTDGEDTGVFYCESEGIEYTGQFQGANITGWGVMRYPNGDVFTGEHAGGWRNGRGEYAFASGDVYRGDWVDDLHHGLGEYISVDGNLYSGQWAHGKRHGVGELAFYDKHSPWKGNVYRGAWESGLMHGYGQMAFESGETYQGQFTNDYIHGCGRNTRFEGTVIRDYIWSEGAETEEECFAEEILPLVHHGMIGNRSLKTY